MVYMFDMLHQLVVMLCINRVSCCDGEHKSNILYTVPIIAQIDGMNGGHFVDHFNDREHFLVPQPSVLEVHIEGRAFLTNELLWKKEGRDVFESV